MSRSIRAVLASSILLALAANAQAAQRAFVASTGNDANTASSCAPTTPCRSFTAAHSVVDAGGEIIALDSAGYGTLTITKSVTIAANPGVIAGIAASTGNAITIATASVEVTLRGLNLNGVGAAFGIEMTAGAQLNVENCVVSNFATDGIRVNNVASVRVDNTVVRGNTSSGLLVRDDTRADVINSRFLNNGLVGVWAGPPSTIGIVVVSDSVVSGSSYGFATTDDGRMSIARSTASNNGAGIYVAQTGIVSVGYSQVAYNAAIGLFNDSVAATLESMGNNLVRGNPSNTAGTITPIAGS